MVDPLYMVEVTTLADGLVVRLAGVLGAAEVPALRQALLRPRPAACRDLLVDAGGVDAIDRESLNVIAVASLQRATELGAEHADFRLERLRSQRLRFRDDRLEMSIHEEVTGFAVRVAH